MSSLFGGKTAPVTPVATPPPSMPDAMSPDALDAKRRAMSDASRGSRNANQLTSAVPRAQSTIAGSYSAPKLGAA